MDLRVEPMSDVLGARVTGIDLRDGLDDATFAELRRIWLDHLVILLPGQDISSEQQAAFATGFGVLTTPRDSAPQSDDQPNSLLITNVRDTGMRTALEKDAMLFHTDGAYFEKPCLATLLYSIEASKTGGETLLANCYDAYDALPDEMKLRIDGLTATNAFATDKYNTRVHELEPGMQHFSHPLAITHNETGRKALFVSRMLTVFVDGMDERESNDLLDQLFDHLERPEFVCAHKWTPGDLLMWDNRCTMHGRNDFAPDDRRMLRRMTLDGVRPH